MRYGVDSGRCSLFMSNAVASDSPRHTSGADEMLHDSRIRYVLRFGEKDVNRPWTFHATLDNPFWFYSLDETIRTQK